MPVVRRGLRDRGGDPKKKAARVGANLCALVTDPADMAPYVEALLPELQVLPGGGTALLHGVGVVLQAPRRCCIHGRGSPACCVVGTAHLLPVPKTDPPDRALSPEPSRASPCAGIPGRPPT